MIERLQDLSACPLCKAQLRRVADSWHCEACRKYTWVPPREVLAVMPR